MNVPAHYTLDGVCAACRGAIRITDARYTVREAVYHADCFDISLFGARPEPIDGTSGLGPTVGDSPARI